MVNVRKGPVDPIICDLKLVSLVRVFPPGTKLADPFYIPSSLRLFGIIVPSYLQPRGYPLLRSPRAIRGLPLKETQEAFHREAEGEGG